MQQDIQDMNQFTKNDLWSLEDYAQKRPDFYAKHLQHRKIRQVELGDNARLCFEDEITVRFQIQEMLRIEKTFEADGIQEELDAYNPLLPDGNNWKATFLIEYPDPDVRKHKLTQLKGIEKTVWVQVEGCEKVYPICNEDLDRENDEKTSAVHFMRFELSDNMITTLKNGAVLNMGIEHENYSVPAIAISETTRESLLFDLH